jgi:hypothetical protein
LGDRKDSFVIVKTLAAGVAAAAATDAAAVGVIPIASLQAA